MRAVTTATAASVLGIDRKALDGLLLRLGPTVIPRGRQGVERRIPVSLLEVLALSADISAGLGSPLTESFHVAQLLLEVSPIEAVQADGGRRMSPASGGPGAELTSAGHAAVGEYLQVKVDAAALRREIASRLEVAIESVVRPRRGRPRKARLRGA